MSHPNPSTALATAVVDELARHGVRLAVISPGSRSTALVIALDSHPDIDTVVNIDERSAGFRALGSSMASGDPVVVVTTSGSAVANLLPALVEADRSGVRLVLLTGDRPPELVERRANQTMDHVAVSSGFVRAMVELGPASPDVDGNDKWRTEVSNALHVGAGVSPAGPGPVHLNLAFSEPTVAYTDDGRTPGRIYPHDTPGAAGRHPFTPSPILASADPATLPDLGDRVIVLVGSGDHDSREIVDAAASLGGVVAATAISGGRGSGAIARYHHLLVGGVPDALQPTGVVVAGRVSPAERLLGLTAIGVPVVHVDTWGSHSDPAGTMTVGVTSDPIDVVGAIGPQAESWSGQWSEAESAVDEVIRDSLKSVRSLSGPLIAETLNQLPWQTLVVGSSLPIRDVDAHLVRRGTVLANRGVSGIDGFVSTFLGVATGRERTLAIVGDLSFLHDSNGFLTDRTPDGVILVVDNDGGGLFDLLPQSRLAPEYERFFVTPHRRKLSELAAFHGLQFVDVADTEGLASAVEDEMSSNGVTIVRASVDREFDVSQRVILDQAARGVMASMFGSEEDFSQ